MSESDWQSASRDRLSEALRVIINETEAVKASLIHRVDMVLSELADIIRDTLNDVDQTIPESDR